MMLNTKMKQRVARILAGVTLFSAVATISGVTQSQVAEAAPAVTSGRVNFRVGPSTNYSVLGKINQGTLIDVISHNSNWSKITESGKTGYISNRYIDFSAKGQITGRVNLRSQGSNSGRIITKIPAGETVQVLAGPSSGWYKVVWNSSQGYVYKNYIRLNETTAKSSPVVDDKTFAISSPITTYMTAADAANSRNAVGSYKAGTYHIYRKYSGMLNISTRQGRAGAWVNPSAAAPSETLPVTGGDYPGYTPFTWTVSFYTSLAVHNGGWTVTAIGTPLRYGVLASNYWPIHSKVILPGWGEFTVEDRGGKNFDSKYRLDMLIPRKSGESDYQYTARIWSMGLKDISGYIKPSK